MTLPVRKMFPQVATQPTWQQSLNSAFEMTATLSQTEKNKRYYIVVSDSILKSSANEKTIIIPKRLDHSCKSRQSGTVCDDIESCFYNMSSKHYQSQRLSQLPLRLWKQWSMLPQTIFSKATLPQMTKPIK